MVCNIKDVGTLADVLRKYLQTFVKEYIFHTMGPELRISKLIFDHELRSAALSCSSSADPTSSYILADQSLESGEMLGTTLLWEHAVITLASIRSLGSLSGC
jgi:hypothetical protein